MSRGNGRQAQQAIGSGKLAAFIKPASGGESNGGNPEYVDWGEVDGRLIAGAVVSVNKEGGSLLFGHTRDKKSYSIMVFYGGDKTPYYFPCNESGVESMVTFLYGLIEVGT